MRITGERIVTCEGGFNPTWQRHAANYRFAAEQLPAPRSGAGLGGERILDLGCGTGHAASYLDGRWSVGADLDLAALAAQDRPGVRADIRRLPFPDHTFGAVICLHAVEHVPDPVRVVAECARLVGPNGVAVLATPNRLTFGRPDEVIDPYHFIEFSPAELAALCRRAFSEVAVVGLFGSPRYMEFFSAERRKLDRMLALDPLRLRRLVPRPLRQRLYDWRLTKERTGEPPPRALAITTDDFFLRDGDLDAALDLMAVCRAAR